MKTVFICIYIQMLMLLYDNVARCKLHDVIYLLDILIERDSPLVVFISTFITRDFVFTTRQGNIMRVKEFTSLNMTNDNRLVYTPELCIHVNFQVSLSQFHCLYLHHHIAHHLHRIEEPSRHHSRQILHHYRNN